MNSCRRSQKFLRLAVEDSFNALNIETHTVALLCISMYVYIYTHEKFLNIRIFIVSVTYTRYKTRAVQQKKKYKMVSLWQGGAT